MSTSTGRCPGGPLFFRWKAGVWRLEFAQFLRLSQSGENTVPTTSSTTFGPSSTRSLGPAMELPAPFGALTARRALFARAPFFEPLVVNSVDKKNNVQSSLYKTIMHDPLLHGLDWATLAQVYFRSILKSIRTLGESKFLWHSLQMNAIKLMELKVPPRIISCIFLTHANAWCTNSRFGGANRKCQICRQDFLSESLSHFAECRFLKALGEHFLGLCMIHNQTQFFVLAREHECVVGRRAIHLYACKRAFDSCRHHSAFEPDMFIKVYQSALISLWAKNQCTKLMCKSLIFGPPPAVAQVDAKCRPLLRIAGSVQTVLNFQPRASL